MADHQKQHNAGLGMRFPQSVIRQLRDLRLTVKTSVSVVYQQRAKRWLLAGEEGGGSLKDIAHYVGYVASMDDALKFSLPIQALIPNAAHRRVAGTSLVRFEILRYGGSCDLSVSHLFLHSTGENRRPTIRRETLFQARSGVLTSETVAPIFFDPSGEEIELNPLLLEGIRTLSKASFCMHCRHAHFIPVKPVDVQSVLATLRARPEPAAEADKATIPMSPSLPPPSGPKPRCRF
jgi:hypothetical protein